MIGMYLRTGEYFDDLSSSQRNDINLTFLVALFFLGFIPIIASILFTIFVVIAGDAQFSNFKSAKKLVKEKIKLKEKHYL